MRQQCYNKAAIVVVVVRQTSGETRATIARHSCNWSLRHEHFQERIDRTVNDLFIRAYLWSSWETLRMYIDIAAWNTGLIVVTSPAQALQEAPLAGLPWCSRRIKSNKLKRKIARRGQDGAWEPPGLDRLFYGTILSVNFAIARLSSGTRGPRASRSRLASACIARGVESVLLVFVCVPVLTNSDLIRRERHSIKSGGGENSVAGPALSLPHHIRELASRCFRSRTNRQNKPTIRLLGPSSHLLLWCHHTTRSASILFRASAPFPMYNMLHLTTLTQTILHSYYTVLYYTIGATLFRKIKLLSEITRL